MLRLRRGSVRAADAEEGPERIREQGLTVELEDGELRPAIADVGLVGRCEVGDEVIVNVEAYDLRLGSGGFDVVHVNLTRGLGASGLEGAHVMKLNYSSLQHAILPVEERDGEREPSLPLGRPVATIALHGQLAPLAWAFRQARPAARLGYVQTAGGALAGSHSRTARRLRERGLLAGHVTAGPCYGGEMEALTTAGALCHGLRTLGWDAAVCGPGPGIVGSGSALGHGGMQALDSAHAALGLGAEVIVVPRLSMADPRPRHKGLSHHSSTVLRLLLAPVVVALPSAVEGRKSDSALELSWPDAWAQRMTRHDWRQVPVDLPGFARSGLPDTTMGRSLAEDPWFFAAALAGGHVLGQA